MYGDVGIADMTFDQSVMLDTSCLAPRIGERCVKSGMGPFAPGLILGSEALGSFFSQGQGMRGMTWTLPQTYFRRSSGNDTFWEGECPQVLALVGWKVDGVTGSLPTTLPDFVLLVFVRVDPGVGDGANPNAVDGVIAPGNVGDLPVGGNAQGVVFLEIAGVLQVVLIEA